MQAEYIDHMGSDLTVVNAARVSFNKKSEVLDAKDEKLIDYLASHGHWTPFAHAVITMRETVPIFVARQRFKHTVGWSYNEVSRRYVSDKPEFYTPLKWRSAPVGSVKQGSGLDEITRLKFEIVDPIYGKGFGYEEFDTSISDVYENLLLHAELVYNAMIENNVAPEQARMVLPQSMYTSYHVTGSLYAWANAYKQRSDPHAQLEIQELAKDWDKVISELFPYSWDSLKKS